MLINIPKNLVKNTWNINLDKLAQSAKTSGGNYYNNMKDSNGKLFGEFIFSLYQADRLSIVEVQNILKIAPAGDWIMKRYLIDAKYIDKLPHLYSYKVIIKNSGQS